MSRWRVWDMVCSDQMWANKPSENDPIPVAGCTEEIPHVSLSSIIVLPREALLSDEGKGGKKSRGRGRSLATRALCFHKPSRRPGERDNKEESRKSTLGSRFLDSEYLYEELFPSLEQSTKKTDPESLKPTKSAWSSKQTKERTSLRRPMLVVEQTTNTTGSVSEKSKDKSYILDKDPPRFSTSYNSANNTNTHDCDKKDTTEISDTNSEQTDKVEFGAIGSKASRMESQNNSESMIRKTSREFDQDKQSEKFNHVTDKLEDCQNSTDLKEANSQGDDWIENDQKDNEQWQSDDDWIENEQLIQQCNTGKCDQLCRSPNDETGTCDKIKQIENFKDQSAEYNNYTDLTTDEHNTTDVLSSLMQDTINTENSSLTNDLFSHSNSDIKKPKKYIESEDTQEDIKDSLDMSTTSEEFDPCDVLLENLPLALTDEELKDIVEPYGEMVSSNFKENDNRNKTCVVRMANSMSGELLVISLDGLEIDGQRLKVTMDNSQV